MVSRKMNKSGALSMNKTQDLYQDALQRQKQNDDSRDQNKFKEMEHKQIMNVKSRKILYEHFISKFNEICEKCGVQEKVEYDQYLRIVKHIVF
jgi:phage-related minor tail protein